ncbi:hypothetical protein V5799_015052, partial [Amblyomma americanum]
MVRNKAFCIFKAKSDAARAESQHFTRASTSLAALAARVKCTLARARGGNLVGVSGLCKLVASCSGKSLSPVLRETMALYRERRRREFLVTCPFNPAHQVKNGRFQIHIMKCEK